MGLTESQKAFALASVESGALKIDRDYLSTGSFADGISLKLKDGRPAGYFFNAGKFHRGVSQSAMGRAYAEAAKTRFIDENLDFDMVFGPAYKGITIASSMVDALWNDHKIDKGWAYRRKEAKTHGEKGAYVGLPFTDEIRVLMVDDVITSAKTKIDEKRNMDSYTHDNGLAYTLVGLLIALDRQQKAVIEEKQLDVGAVKLFEERTGRPVHSILTSTQLMEHLHQEKIPDDSGQHALVDDDVLKGFRRYQKEFGTT